MSRALEIVRTLVLVAFLLLTLSFFGPAVAVDAMVYPYRTCEVSSPHSDEPVLVRRSLLTGAARWQVPSLPNLFEPGMPEVYGDAGRWLASGELTTASLFFSAGFRGGYRSRSGNDLFEVTGYNGTPFDLYATSVRVQHTSGADGYYTLRPAALLGTEALPAELLATFGELLGANVTPRIRSGTYGTLVSGPVHPDASDRVEEVDGRTWSWDSTEYLISFEIPPHVCR